MGSRRRSTAQVALVAAALALTLPASAQTLEDLFRSARGAAFSPVVPRVANRPGVLLETDFYVYGPGTGFSVPEVVVSVDSNSFNAPVTLFLYWENRNNGQRQFFGVGTGFGAQERDLFGAPGSPAAVFVPDLEELRLFGPGSAFGALPAAIPRSTGLYQFVLEIRDADGENVIARGNAMYNHVDGVVPVSGNLDGGNWTNDNAYYLSTPVNVTGGTLNVQAGTVILGSKGGQGTLVVRQGARITAVGDETRPIIFTSELPVGQRAPGDWGGLVINGSAPVNIANPTGEGDSGPYGGDDANSDSGALSYVRVEFAGIRFSDQNELNGIAIQGVGKGTQLDHLQVHFNQDDGIEFFGGTADAKYVLVTDAEDDSLDWTFGWNGRLQHFVAVQRHGPADSGIEADGQEQNPGAQPFSDPTIFNATWVGADPLPGVSTGRGILLRRGTHATIKNFIVTNFTNLGIEINGAESEAQVGTGIDISHGFIFANAAGASDVQTYLQGQPNVLFSDPRLVDPYGLSADVTPLSPQARGAGSAAAPPADGFFDNVNYVGGVDPNDPWIFDGWTTFSDN